MLNGPPRRGRLRDLHNIPDPQEHVGSPSQLQGLTSKPLRFLGLAADAEDPRSDATPGHLSRCAVWGSDLA